MNRKLLYTLLIVFSLATGSYLTYVVEGINYISILSRSAIILLFPFILTAIASGIYRLLKKRNISSKLFDKTLSVLWVIGVSTEFITYFFL